MPNCPCGSNLAYADCCQPFHNGANAPTPEALMRSRYSAFCKSLVDYLINTHHPSKQAADDREVLEQSIQSTEWLGLTIVDAQPVLTEATGVVEFIATFQEGGELGQLHERSNFVKENDRWLYVDGMILPVEPLKVGRNDPCPCGSGKKFKKCHG